jgi:type II secretory pathway pseudopilin PulG
MKTDYRAQEKKNSFRMAWTLLEMLIVLTLIAVFSVLIFPAAQTWQQQLVQRASLSLLLRSCEEARSHAMTQRLTTWLLLQHSCSRKDSFALLQETENNTTTLISSWKELPTDVHFTLSPAISTTLPEPLRLKLPQDLRPISDRLKGIAWNNEGSIVTPLEKVTLTLLTTSNKRITQILLLKNSGRAVLIK